MARFSIKKGNKLNASTCRKKQRGESLKKWRESTKHIVENTSATSSTSEIQPIASVPDGSLSDSEPSSVPLSPTIRTLIHNISSPLNTSRNETSVPVGDLSDLEPIALPLSPIIQASSSEITPSLDASRHDDQSEQTEVSTSSSKHPPEKFEGHGRRIVELFHLIEKFQELDKHNQAMGCTFSDMEVVDEVRRGYISILKMKCRMCNGVYRVYTDKQNRTDMDVNTAAVSGATCIGIGHYQLEELHASMNMPSMGPNTYAKYHDSVADGWEETALLEMAEAAKEEAAIARKLGEVDAYGTPILLVVTDGSWCKRSYRINYNSLSGVAAIVGYRTRKVLFIGVRNRYCTFCAREEVDPDFPKKEHRCFKYWSSSSTSMESDIIVQGFNMSMEMYGVKYGSFIADGDSSVFKKIIDSRPYTDLTVEKIECRNHLLRNFCNKLRDVATNSKNNINERRLLGGKILKLRCNITEALRYRKKEDGSNHSKITNLRRDILNGPNHTFGNHANCSPYFCKGPKEGEKNLIPPFSASGFLVHIMIVVNYIADHSRSLIENVDNNVAEQFNSIIAKFIGGKRVNYALKRSYSARVSGAVVSHNTRTPLTKLHRTMYEVSPGKFTKRMEMRRMARNQRDLRNLKRKPYGVKTKSATSLSVDKDYGPGAQQPDMPEDLFALKREEFLYKIQRSDEARKQIERDTIHQSDSRMWKDLRREIITASNFGIICNKNRRPYTGCESFVTELLYRERDSASMRHGRDNEDKALRAVEQTANVHIVQCGLHIDQDIPYLGATPDGLINDDGVAEVKCPYSCVDITPEEGILQRKIKLWLTDKTKTKVIGIDTNHAYYYQVQGQLHITRRKYCLFAVWTPKGLKMEKIERDDEFWANNMIDKLTTFYMDCILPELVDARHRRSMPIRNPPYILKAQEEQTKKKAEKIVKQQALAQKREEESRVDHDSGAVGEQQQECVVMSNKNKTGRKRKSANSDEMLQTVVTILDNDQAVTPRRSARRKLINA